jgi:hypothetical protein
MKGAAQWAQRSERLRCVRQIPKSCVEAGVDRPVLRQRSCANLNPRL